MSQLVQLAAAASVQVAQVWSHRWHCPPDWYFPLAHSATQRLSSRALEGIEKNTIFVFWGWRRRGGSGERDRKWQERARESERER